MPVIPRIDAFAGGKDPYQLADVILTNASWIYRRSNEIIAEQALGLDVVKIYDLANQCLRYKTHCDMARDGNGDLQNIRTALVDRTRQLANGAALTETEINDAYKALYVAVDAFITWAEANLPGATQTVPNVTVTVNKAPWTLENGNPAGRFDYTARVPLLAAVLNRVTTLRAQFPA